MLFIIWKFSKKYVFDFPPITLPSLFLIKLCVGIVFLFLYLKPDTNNNLPSDTMRYLGEGKMLHNVFKESPTDYFKLLTGIGESQALIDTYLDDSFLWNAGSTTIINDSKHLIRFQSLIYFISFDSPYIHMLFMALLSLIGTFLLYKAFKPFVNLTPILFLIILTGLPNVLFWNSGILKEPILILGLGMLAYGILSQNSILKKILFCFLALLILVSFKPYIVACTLPAFFFFILYQFAFKNQFLKTVISCLLILVTLLLLFPKERQAFTVYLSKKQADFDHIGKGGLHAKTDTCFYYFSPAQFPSLNFDYQNKTVVVLDTCTVSTISYYNNHPSKIVFLEPTGEKLELFYCIPGAKSYIKTTQINHSFRQLLFNIPEAIINAYFRPFLKDNGGKLKYIAFLELWFLTGFLVLSIILRKKLTSKEKGMVYVLSFSVLSILILIGLTTPVIGAITRYRFPAQIGILLIASILLDFEKIKHLYYSKIKQK
jgi:hypothetical protein